VQNYPKKCLKKEAHAMTNREKYDQLFMDCFSVEKSKLNDEFVYNNIPEWDSIGHMQMIAAIEDGFDIMMETDDIIDFSSYTKGMEILAKYDIVF
jgi:acyl carrier protein